MPNTNLLKNTRCPNCGSEGPFRIAIEATALVHDDGTDEVEWVSWHPESWCQCQGGDCDYEGTAAEFGYEVRWI